MCLSPQEFENLITAYVLVHIFQFLSCFLYTNKTGRSGILSLLFRVALNSNNSQKHNYALYNLNINIYLTLNL
jgi:hypothetical protein